mmetsp:Transcript_1373/g.3045  ORF Transcript_1373/g.3045 Transcript_1373/m.3045 type:complete len:329 (-) Transcript_1373:150-1136(-)
MRPGRSAAVWYEKPSSMEATSTPGRLPCRSAGSANTLKSVSTGRFAKRTRSRMVAVAVGWGAARMYVAAGHPPASRNRTSGPPVPVASTFSTTPTEGAQGWCATKPCAACMNVSSPPLKRNTMGAAGRRVACVRARTISSMMPTHDAQSAAPGEPSVVSKWPFTSTALPAVSDRMPLGAIRTARLVRLVYALAMSLLRKLRRKEPVARCSMKSTSKSPPRVSLATRTSSRAASATYISARSRPGLPTTRTPMPWRGSASACTCCIARSSEKRIGSASRLRGVGRLCSTDQRAAVTSAATHSAATAGWTRAAGGDPVASTPLQVEGGAV